jgi:hypothetical protein
MWGGMQIRMPNQPDASKNFVRKKEKRHLPKVICVTFWAILPPWPAGSFDHSLSSLSINLSGQQTVYK